MASRRSATSRGAGRTKLFVKLAVSLGLLLYLLERVDLAKTAHLVASAKLGWILAALVVYLAGQVLSTAKWRLLARAVGFRGGFREYLRHYFIGMFFNAFGFGTVGGDVVRAFYLAGPGGRRGLALNTVVADRVSGLLVLLAIAFVSLVVFHQYDLPAVLYWTTLLLSAGLLVGWRSSPRLLPLVLGPENRLRRLVELDLKPYWNDYGLLSRVAGLSLVFHLSQLLVLALLTRAFGISVPGSYFFIFGPLVNILAAIPVSLNGLGVRESSYVFFLSHIGVAREPAIGFALGWFGIILAGGLVGGIVYLAARSIGPPPDEETSAAEGERHREAAKSTTMISL